MNAIPEHIGEKYFYGNCMYLAVALHNLFGWEIRANIESSGADEWIGHAWVINNEGVAVDIDGVHKSDIPDYADNLRCSMTPSEVRSLTKLTETEFSKKLADAREVISQYCENFVG